MSSLCKLTNFIDLLEDDTIEILNWRNHPEVRKWFYGDHAISLEEHSYFINRLKNSDREIYFKGEDIGVVSLSKIDMKLGHAYLGIYTNPWNQKKMKGRILLNSLLNYAFRILKLETVKLEVFSVNERAVRFYQQNGFKNEGCLRNFGRYNGTFCDVIVMGILASEFVGKE